MDRGSSRPSGRPISASPTRSCAGSTNGCGTTRPTASGRCARSSRSWYWKWRSTASRSLPDTNRACRCASRGSIGSAPTSRPPKPTPSTISCDSCHQRRMADLSSGKLPAQTHTLSVKERVALGRALRERLARKHHARWAPQRQRRDPIEILIEQGQSRLPDLLPLRHARMKASPFAFMRGAAAVMASDLATTEVSGLRVQAAGDCHCLNFGGFATPERRLAFDINDFDETAVAPFEWDVKRLAASVVVATLDQFGADARLDLAQSVARAYREIMARIAGRTVLDEWYRVLTLDEAEARAIGLDGKALKKADRALKHAVTLIDMRHTCGRSPTIQDQPPLVYHPPRSRGAAFRGDVETMLAEYVATLSPERQLLLQRYRLAD